ncbi:MAG: NADH-quinone oxidoreductase subunit N [Thermodesulfobacteriota bacterium]
MSPEFILPAVNLQCILPQILLCLTALAVLLIDVFQSGKKANLLALVSLAGAVLATLTLFSSQGLNETAFSGMILVDGFSFFLGLTICLILIMTILVGMNYQRFFEGINCGEYYSLLLFSAVGMMFMASAGNLILLFVALELMSVSIYVLVGFHKTQLRSVEAALKYFLLGAFAASFLLLGFAFLYGATGTMDILAMTKYIQTNPEVLQSGLLLAGALLTVTGLGFKISMVPFHMWTPDVYDGAPTVITGFMATGVKSAAFAALVRIFMVPLSSLPLDWTMVFWVAAVLTMTIGNFIALAQDSIKRMLAYSGIAHAGYLLIGVVAGGEMAQAGILFYLLVYAFMNIGAFGVLALLGKKETEYNTLNDFSGLGLKYPILGLAMVVFMFSLAGIPPTGGFMGKLYIFSAAIESGYVWLVVLGAANSVVAIYYYLRVIAVMYFKEGAGGQAVFPAPSPAISLGLGLAAAGIMILGVFPSSFWDLARNSVFLY